MVARIRKETSGEYRHLLLELFGDGGFDPQRDAKVTALITHSAS